MADLSHDFRLFRYALASAERGSFRRAAAALNVQQSTVSRGVRSLEHRIGAELFERHHAGIRPTSAGERFLQEAALGFGHLERAMERIGAIQRGERGEITIAASVPFFLLGDAFEQFRAKHRGVLVEAVEGTCEESIVLVEQRAADIAFLTRVAGNRAALSLHLWDEPMIAVLPSSHRLAGRARVLHLEALRTETFVLGAGGLGPHLEEYLGRHLGGSGGGPNLQVHRVSQCDIVSMVAHGFGVTIIAGRLRHPVPEGVVLVPLADTNTIPIHAVWMRANPNPAIKAMLGVMRKAVLDRRGTTGREAN